MNIGMGIIVLIGSFFLLIATVIEAVRLRKKNKKTFSVLTVLTVLGFILSILLLTGIYDPYANNHNIQ
ncbi:hypothetical protein ACFWM3_14290 [Gottfriedia sp. NPDC058432]|uniref:hypothetical protein n=1 Tax=Gottfriedia sp. NPDC058432 TaxID=3346497 RepID=UPI003655E24D